MIFIQYWAIWGHREEAQRPLHETMRLAEARLERHAPGRSMPSEAPKHCKIQSRRDAPKMAILEAPCAQNAPGRSTMRPPEALLPRNPTWGSPPLLGSHNHGLASRRERRPQSSLRVPSLFHNRLTVHGTKRGVNPFNMVKT